MTNKEIREKVRNILYSFEHPKINDAKSVDRTRIAVDQIMQILEEECEKAFKEGEKIGI